MAEEGYQVSLNVYDLSQGLARQMSSTFLGKVIEGIWHTGIVVYGNEYYFGGGIQSCPLGQTPYGKPLRVVELGTTQIPKEVFEDYLAEIRPRFTEQTYSLLRHNCNNFCEEVAQFLLGISIPEYILKLPEEVMNSPMGALIMPMIQQFETILRYGGVPQVPHVAGDGASTLNQMPISFSPTSNGTNASREPQPQKPTLTTSSEAATVLRDASTTSAAPVAPNRETLSVTGPTADKLGDARARVQEEITREFAALMAEGQLRASEAAALAARRVMERHGRGAGLAQKS
ncbi:hypothetical protein GOP47_0025615 [Adiantum capillus-veneris]|uniref:PPPDE domain-containing protein n=1 Tax=Adiantum capillus-veneris TaxID=13818 RepID=A0A9D4U325_ADICA|nr:hypothetical protein GOP47_0025615 [Adiantum capillus-veneris]